MLKGLFGKRIRLATLKERQSKFGNYDLVTPNLNYRAEFQDSLIPQDILKPNYSNVKPVTFTDDIHINSPEEIVEIRKASKLAARCLKLAVEHAKVGTTTNMLDRIVFDEVIKNKAYPSPLGYGFPKYPKSICTSINNVLCHGIPDDRPLKSGDIINIDITVFLNGYHGDTSSTVLVGDVDQRGIDLVNDTKYALDLGISVVKPGSNFNEIGNIIQKYANSKRYSIDRNFCGHGIGADFHQAPLILHYANNQSGVFQPGMVFTIEPILVQGCEGYVKWPDQWTVVSRDGSRSAQFEHTVLVTDNGHEILTQ